MHDLVKAEPAINNFNLKTENVSTSIDKIIDDATNVCKKFNAMKSRIFFDNKTEYKASALRVCNDLCSAIQDRFAYKEHLLGASLLSPNNHFAYLENIPDEQLTKLILC